MAATFIKNKSKIQAVLERNLSVVVPKLHSVNLISGEDRDLALDSSVDGSTRAAVLTNAIESKIVNYRTWWIFVYVLLSSELDAERDFFECLTVLQPEHASSDAAPSQSSPLSEALVGRAKSSPPVQERRFRDLKVEKETRDLEAQLSQPHSTPSETTMGSSKDEATSASPTSLSGATDISESETVLSQEGSQHVHDESFSLQSSTWYTHAHEFPGIKFSNYYTKQVVTSMGNIIKGEGIELQIPGRAIEKGCLIEFTVQGCIEGPFELPDGVSLASPVFLIRPHYEFQKKVTLLMDAFISLESPEETKELVFLTSPGKPKIDKDGPHWKFAINDIMPQSTEDNSRIMVEVTQFCLVCSGIRRVPQYRYRVSLHSPRTSVDNTWCRAIFSVSLYHKVFFKNLEVCLDSFPHKFYDTCETVSSLTRERIKLCLPKDTHEEGYKIQADKSPCQILKNAVDFPRLSRKFKKNAMADSKSYPPRIMLTISYTRSLQDSPDCKLKIQGIDEVKSFNMKIPTVELRTPPTLLEVKETIKGTYRYTPILPVKASNTETPTETSFTPLETMPATEDINESDKDGNQFVNDCIERTQGPCKALALPNLLNLRLTRSTTSIINIPQMIERENCCFQFGVKLLGYSRAMMYISWRENIELIFEKWLSGSGEMSVSPVSLAEALRQFSHLRLQEFNSLVTALMKYSSHLTMDIIHNFPVVQKDTRSVNIPRAMGVKYSDFGIHLLQDATGAHMLALERELNRNAEDINKHILIEWLNGQGRPVTWDTLIEVLNIIGMGELAKDIKDNYIR